MARSIQQQLDDIDALIETLEDAQGLIENDSGRSRVVRERLQALYAERRQLQSEIKRFGQSGGGRKFRLGRNKLPT